MATDQETYNKDLVARQTEINEWSYNNKMDTLFVFQLLFISILIICILMMFSYRGVIGKPFVWYTFATLVVVDIVVIINRSMYTNSVRDKTHWDRVIFAGDQKTVSPKGTDSTYVDSIINAYGVNGVTLTSTDITNIIRSTDSPSTLSVKYKVSQDTINKILTSRGSGGLGGSGSRNCVCP